MSFLSGSAANPEHSGKDSSQRPQFRPPYGFDEESKMENGYAWFPQDGSELMFSPNTNQPVEVPPYHPPTWNPSLAEIRSLGRKFFLSPQWYRGTQYAWMSTIPHSYHPSQDGSIFEIFKNVTLSYCAEKISPKEYRMSATLLYQWKEFEANAEAVVGAIFEHMGISQAQVFTIPRPDVIAKYDVLYPSRFHAFQNADRGREWFKVLIGALIYACMQGWSLRATRGGKQVVLHPNNMPSATMSQGSDGDIVEPLKFLPLWFVRVAGARPDLIPFLSLLRVTFSNSIKFVNHVGMFIRIEHVHELGSLGFFIKHRIPICYPWGEKEEAYVRENPSYGCYRPPASLIKAALARKEGNLGLDRDCPNTLPVDIDIHSGLDIHFPVEESPPAFDMNRPPTPPSASARHTPVLTMQGFMRRRELLNRSRASDETPEQRLAREARVQTRNTPMFYWRENSAAEMIRIQVSSRFRALLEDENSGYQRLYDQFCDEVDYALTFDPQPEDFMQAVEMFGSTELYLQDRQMREAYRRRIPELREPERLEEDWSSDSAVDIASHRLGFIRTKDSMVHDQRTANSLWDKIKHCLQLNHLPDGCPPDVHPYASNLARFLQAFKPSSGEEGYGPDVDQWDANPISTFFNNSHAVQELVRLSHNHVLVGQAEECEWSLVVLNDVDALHACRLRDDGMSIRDVAWHFLDRGIACRTMVRHAQTRLLQRLKPPAIEIRIGGYRFDTSDYRSYRRQVRSILSRPGAAFAAFKHGGILWRIVREEYGKLEVAVFEAGPDLSYTAELSSDVSGWVDNELLPEEIAGLCGVYHVPSVTDVDLRDWSNQSDFALAEQVDARHVSPLRPSAEIHQAQSSDQQRATSYIPPERPYPSASSVNYQGSVPLYDHWDSLRSVPSSALGSGMNSNYAHPPPPYLPMQQRPNPGRGIRRDDVIGQRGFNVSRVSWLPTPECMNAARKGNMGHWTGRMEEMWRERINGIEINGSKPLSSSEWAKYTFGTVGKHIWRAATEASREAIDKALGG